MNDRSRIPAGVNSAADTLYHGQWLTLKQRGRWEFVERNNPQGAVIIVAVTPADRVLFVEQYRVPVQQLTIEMPAGLIGDAGHENDDGIAGAARRNLRGQALAIAVVPLALVAAMPWFGARTWLGVGLVVVAVVAAAFAAWRWRRPVRGA
jgi:hypothetical protein